MVQPATTTTSHLRKPKSNEVTLDTKVQRVVTMKDLAETAKKTGKPVTINVKTGNGKKPSTLDGTKKIGNTVFRFNKEKKANFSADVEKRYNFESRKESLLQALFGAIKKALDNSKYAHSVTINNKRTLRSVTSGKNADFLLGWNNRLQKMSNNNHSIFSIIDAIASNKSVKEWIESEGDVALIQELKTYIAKMGGIVSLKKALNDAIKSAEQDFKKMEGVWKRYNKVGNKPKLNKEETISHINLLHRYANLSSQPNFLFLFYPHAINGIQKTYGDSDVCYWEVEDKYRESAMSKAVEVLEQAKELAKQIKVEHSNITVNLALLKSSFGKNLKDCLNVINLAEEVLRNKKNNRLNTHYRATLLLYLVYLNRSKKYLDDYKDKVSNTNNFVGWSNSDEKFRRFGLMDLVRSQGRIKELFKFEGVTTIGKRHSKVIETHQIFKNIHNKVLSKQKLVKKEIENYKNKIKKIDGEIAQKRKEIAACFAKLSVAENKRKAKELGFAQANKQLETANEKFAQANKQLEIANKKLENYKS